VQDPTVGSAKMFKKFVWASWARNGRFWVLFEENGLGPLGVNMWKKFRKHWPHKLQNCSIWSEEKRFFYFTPCKRESGNFDSSWPKTFALHKLEAFDIVLGNWVGNPQKK
jgi:hypothetical protein